MATSSHHHHHHHRGNGGQPHSSMERGSSCHSGEGSGSHMHGNRALHPQMQRARLAAQAAQPPTTSWAVPQLLGQVPLSPAAATTTLAGRQHLGQLSPPATSQAMQRLMRQGLLLTVLGLLAAVTACQTTRSKSAR
jgi:hypothetical protein